MNFGVYDRRRKNNTTKGAFAPSTLVDEFLCLYSLLEDFG